VRAGLHFTFLATLLPVVNCTINSRQIEASGVQVCVVTTSNRSRREVCLRHQTTSCDEQVAAGWCWQLHRTDHPHARHRPSVAPSCLRSNKQPKTTAATGCYWHTGRWRQSTT